MKYILKSILLALAKLVAFLLPSSLIKYTSFFIANITTQYIVKQLNRCGENPIIYFPITSYGLHNICIGNNFNAKARLRLEVYDGPLNKIFTPNIIIGNEVSISYDCHIACANKIMIGNNVLIASKVFITDHFHGNIDKFSLTFSPSIREIISKGPVIIEDNVWIGEGVSIMPNVTIGKNSIIGANSVVTKDIPY